jgi:hypothetical protein
MRLSEFLGDKPHSHCKHCPHVCIVANEHALFNMALVTHAAAHFNAVNTILHLYTCHPTVVKDDPELQAEVLATYGIEFSND